MSGHSKWSNIKHRKAGQDAKRAKVFTKIIRELQIAARDGGGSVEDNPSLRTLVDKAKAAQMPKDTMERAIARGAGGEDGGDAEDAATASRRFLRLGNKNRARPHSDGRNPGCCPLRGEVRCHW